MSQRERDEHIVEQYRQGKPVKEIAGYYKISVPKVYMVIKEAGLDKQKIVIERRAQVKKLHTQGNRARKIAEKLNVEISKVHQDIQILGLTHGQQAIEEAAKRRESVRKLHQQGKSSQEIANILDISIKKVYHDLYVLNLPSNHTLNAHLKETAKRRESVRKLHQQGKFTQEIADILDIPITKVRYDLSILRLASNPMPMGPRVEKMLANMDKRDNTPEWREKIAKSQTGISNNQAILSDEIVTTIRQEYQQALATGLQKTATQMHLASKYGISRSTILDIIHNRTWKHLL